MTGSIHDFGVSGTMDVIVDVAIHRRIGGLIGPVLRFGGRVGTGSHFAGLVVILARDQATAAIVVVVGITGLHPRSIAVAGASPLVCRRLAAELDDFAVGVIARDIGRGTGGMGAIGTSEDVGGLLEQIGAVLRAALIVILLVHAASQIVCGISGRRVPAFGGIVFLDGEIARGAGDIDLTEATKLPMIKIGPAIARVGNPAKANTIAVSLRIGGTTASGFGEQIVIGGRTSREAGGTAIGPDRGNLIDDLLGPHFVISGRETINLVSPDSCEMEEKKSAIFSLPFHNYRVKRDLSFLVKNLG